MFNNLFLGSVSGEEGDAQSQQAMAGRGEAQLEVVDDSADGLHAGAARLPLAEAAELAALHHVHAAPVVGLLVQHPPGHREGVTWAQHPAPAKRLLQGAALGTAGLQTTGLDSQSHPTHGNAPGGVHCGPFPPLHTQCGLANTQSQTGPCFGRCFGLHQQQSLGPRAPCFTFT